MQRARSDYAKDQRRQTLLLAALDEFFEKGFNAARMEDIAGRASVSKGTLYLYFDNKQILFKSLIEEVALPTVNATISATQSDISAALALRQLLQKIVVVIRTTPLPKLVKVIIADGRAFPELVTYYREQVLDKMLKRLESLLQQGVENGEWHCNDITNTSRLIVAPILFSVIWRMVFETPDSKGKQPVSTLNLDSLLELHYQHITSVLSLKPESVYV